LFYSLLLQPVVITILTDQIGDIQLAGVDGKFTYFDNVRNFDASEHEDKSKDKYHMFGVTAGYPGGMNLLYGIQYKDVGLRISGGAMPVMVGWKGSIVYNLYKSKHLEQSLAITSGIRMSMGPGATNGVSHGITYSINIRSIFVEVGVARNNEHAETVLIGQAGIVWRFN
jgi:hypothetical protein